MCSTCRFGTKIVSDVRCLPSRRRLPAALLAACVLMPLARADILTRAGAARVTRPVRGVGGARPVDAGGAGLARAVDAAGRRRPRMRYHGLQVGNAM